MTISICPSLFDKDSEDGSVHTLPEDDFGNDIDDRVDEFGNIVHIETNIEACIRDAGEPWDDDDDDLSLHSCAQSFDSDDATATEFIVAKQEFKPTVPKYETLRPFLGWVNSNRVRETLRNTTQNYRPDSRETLRRHFKTRFPAANVNRINETVCTDTLFSDTPAHNDGIPGHGGATMAQLYVGRSSGHTKLYPMKTESQMHQTLEDYLRDEGAPNLLFSDNAKTQTGFKVHDILRLYKIKDFQSEPHQQNQNYAERRIGELKDHINQVMDRTNTPPKYWLLCALFLVSLLNVVASENIAWKTPTEWRTNQLPDISPFLVVPWFAPVYYKVDGSTSKSKEASGRYVGPAEKQGDILTHLVLTDDTEQVIATSLMRPKTDSARNLRADNPPDPTLDDDASLATADGEVTPTVESTNGETFKYVFDCPELAGFNNSADIKLPTFSPSELIGKSFLYDTDDGQKVRAEVVRKVMNREAEDHEKIQMIVSLGNDEEEEIIAYNKLCEIIEKEHERELNDPDRQWIFKSIDKHDGPLKASDPQYNGSSYNVLVKWEDGSETWEPLKMMIVSDPVTCAEYASTNKLLETEGWKGLKRYTKRTKKFQRMKRQAMLASLNTGRIFKFGYEVPRTKHEAYKLDAKNGNTKWVDAMTNEVTQLGQYETFKDHGTKRPEGYKLIRVHFVFDVKHDGRHKARLVAGGHMTAPPRDSVYSGVVSLKSIRLALLAAELNGLEVQATDVGNAYLEAETREKIYIVAGKEFGELEGHFLVVFKALYGLRTSGARWHEKFASTLRAEGFTPSKADPDLWIRDAGDVYEYICVYVDDLLCMMKDAKGFLKILTDKHGYKLKGSGEPTYHLGATYSRDADGTFSMGAKAYIKKILENYEQTYGEKPKEVWQPLPSGDHPEIDTSDLLPPSGISQYQSLIGELQWAITLGQFDLLPAMVSLARFRTAPRIGHLDRLKRVYGYLKHYPDGAIRFRTGIPDFPIPDHAEYEWLETAYGPIKEELPHDMPPPKGKPVRITTFKDANLYHDYTTGRAATGILHFINKTPIEWYSKRQDTVETATYGSEFVAAKVATEQIIAMRYAIRMMGIPLDGPAWLFGDNQSVITSSTIPHSALGKRHTALAYHRVREAVAAGVMYFCKIDGKQNPADCLTKYVDHGTYWPVIEPILFWKGETFEVKDNDPASKQGEGSDKS